MGPVAEAAMAEHAVAPEAAPATAAPVQRDTNGRFASRAARDEAAVESLAISLGAEPKEAAPAPVAEAAPAKQNTNALPEDGESSDAAVDSKVTPDAKAWERALTALRRAQVPQDVIASYDDKKLLQWGSKLADAQSAADRAFQEASRKAKPETETAPVAAETAQVQPAVDLKALVQPITDAYGDEALGAAVLKVVEAANKQAVDPLLKQLEQSNSRRATSDAVLEALLVNHARQSLGERFPQLMDATKSGPALDKAKALLATGHYSDSDPIANWVAAVSDASSIVFAGELQAERVARVNESNARKASAAPTVTSRQSPPTALSKDDKVLGVITDLLEGKTPEELRPKYGFKPGY